MRGQTFQKRLERAEQAAKAQSRFSRECICFPENEKPSFVFPVLEDMAIRTLCPLHGVRLQKSFQVYVAGWLRKKLPDLLWTHHSAQFRKAWFATFPPNLWPAVEERTDDGRTLLRLKDGTAIPVV
jgi:hypothetical protein